MKTLRVEPKDVGPFSDDARVDTDDGLKESFADVVNKHSIVDSAASLTKKEVGTKEYLKPMNKRTNVKVADCSAAEDTASKKVKLTHPAR